MSRDEIIAVVLVAAFAVAVTAHLSLVAGLLARAPRWRAAIALAVPPLAPYWGHREGMRGRASAWIVATLAYAVARWFARR